MNWARPGDETTRPAIWNGAVIPARSCPWKPSRKLARQDGEDTDVCQRPNPTESITSSNAPTTLVTITATGPTNSEMPLPTDLPTLPGNGGSIVTPTGSSCAQTGTVTQCAIGPGGREACVSTPTCVSWVATATSTTPPEPKITKTPLELKVVVCNNESDFPGHADISESSLKGTVGDFCAVDALGLTMDSGSLPVEETWNDMGGNKFRYTVSWIDGCVTEGDTQDVYEPLGRGKPDCHDIFYHTWRDCEFCIAFHTFRWSS